MLDKIILCDFDGTITLEDSSVKILEQFVEEDWEQYDSLLENGKISLHECMQIQFGMIKAEKSSIVESLNHISLREGFKEFVQFCTSQRIPLIVVSAGLDFVIETVLSLHNLTLPVIVT